jgi:hypothetical protein
MKKNLSGKRFNTYCIANINKRFFANFASTLANLFNVFIEFDTFFIGDFEEFKKTLLNPSSSSLSKNFVFKIYNGELHSNITYSVIIEVYAGSYCVVSSADSGDNLYFTFNSTDNNQPFEELFDSINI